MNEADLLKRITVNPEIFSGKPIIRGRRIAVEHILGMLAAGATEESILEHYPYLEAEDIRAALESHRDGAPILFTKFWILSPREFFIKEAARYA